LFITLNVLNYSSNTTESKVIEYIDNLFSELAKMGIDIGCVQIKLNDKRFYNMVEKFVDTTPNNKPLINDDKLLLALNEYYFHGDRFVIIGEKFVTENPWGDARISFITVIKHITEKNIWHEVAHVLGAEDHYIKNSYDVIDNCIDDNCIMRYGRYNGTFCSTVINEIKTNLNAVL
jgi:hypothetical protein